MNRKLSPSPKMIKNLYSPESKKPAHFAAAEYGFDDASICDLDYFVKKLSGLKANGVHPDLIGSIITHYAAKWLPGLAAGNDAVENGLINFGDSAENVTASWIKKRLCIETLVGILPPEKDAIPCDFLLRLLRIANMVGVEPAYRAELEKRIAWRLDGASLKELMIPSFSHTCGTLLDVELVLRLLNGFVNLDEGAVKSGAALVKVAKLADCFLAEAAVDSNLSFPEFLALAGALPGHSRSTDDGLYRAIDTYLKAHPGASKQERKTLFRLINSHNLSSEASFHAAQNDRLPVRALIQVLFSEQAKLHRQFDSSFRFNDSRSPNCPGIDMDARCQSKREVSSQQIEIKRLREHVVRLERQCAAIEGQIGRVVEKNKGFFMWKKLGMAAMRSVRGGGKGGERSGLEGELWAQTPAADLKMKLVTGRGVKKYWRRSVS